MRMLARVMASRKRRKGSKPSGRYGSYPLDSALSVKSRYYEIRQVRRCRNPTHRQTLEGALALGAIGKAILVPASARQVLGQVGTVESYVEARPVLRRSAAPGVRVIGGSDRSEIDSNGEMPSLSESVQAIIRMVRPDLTDEQLAAAAKVSAADIEQDEPDESASGKAAAAQAISAAIEQAGQASESSG
jgi:hypothetical protein